MDARDAALLVALRGQIVDAERRMLDREIEGLRRVQASPDRMRGKIDSFYEGHRATMAKALEPAIRTYLAFAGSTDAPAAVATSVVSRHIYQSRAELLAVLDGDAAVFGNSITAMLTRWDTSRTGQIADDLMELALTR